MNATREQILENVKIALDQLLASLNDMKISICVLLTYVEKGLEEQK